MGIAPKQNRVGENQRKKNYKMEDTIIYKTALALASKDIMLSNSPEYCQAGEIKGCHEDRNCLDCVMQYYTDKAKAQVLN